MSFKVKVRLAKVPSFALKEYHEGQVKVCKRSFYIRPTTKLSVQSSYNAFDCFGSYNEVLRRS